MTSLRPATRGDLELLVSWDDQPHVRMGKGGDDWGWERELGRPRERREQLIAEVDGQPIGYVEIVDPAMDDYWGDAEPNLRAVDIWIGDQAFVGRGHGTALMRLALTRCFDDPAVEAVVVDPMTSNTRAHSFYQKLGFRVVGRRQFGEDDCLVHRLDRSAWEGTG